MLYQCTHLLRRQGPAPGQERKTTKPVSAFWNNGAQVILRNTIVRVPKLGMI